MEEPKSTLMGLWRNNKGFWGAATRIGNGEVLSLTHSTSPYHRIGKIELDSLYQGLLVAREGGYREVEVNVDSKVILHYLKMVSPVEYTTYHRGNSKGSTKFYLC